MVAKNVKRSEVELRAGGSGFCARHAGRELDGRTPGLVGLGRIARRAAEIATTLNMRVATFDPYLDSADFPASITRYTSLEDLVGSSDVVSIHSPLTVDNSGLLDARSLVAMRPGSILGNTARGGRADLPAFADALDAHRLSLAGLDITAPEPLPAGTDAVPAPQVAAGTSEAKRRIFKVVLEQVLQVLGGHRPPHPLNLEVSNRLVPGMR